MSTTNTQYISKDTWITQAVGGTVKYGNGSTDRATIGPVAGSPDTSILYKGRGLYSLTATRMAALLGSRASISIARLKITVAAATCGTRGSAQRIFLEELSADFDTITAASTCSLLASTTHPDAMWPGPTAVSTNRGSLSTSGLTTGDVLTIDCTAIFQARLAAKDFSRFGFRLIAANSGLTTYDEGTAARTVSLYTSKSAGNEPYIETVGIDLSTSNTVANPLPATGSGTANDTVQAPDFDVDGEFGEIVVHSPNTDRYATLSTVSVTGATMKVDFRLDKLPSGGFVYEKLLGRYVSKTNHYEASFIVSPTGAVSGAISKVVAGVTTAIASLSDTGITIAPGSLYHARFATVGTSPTALSASIWADGTAEPDPQMTVSDSTAAMQAASTLGIGVHVGNLTNLPITFSHDEFIAVAA